MYNNLKARQYSIPMMMTMYTPISELPHPPAFMLEEVEQEERKYNTELLMKILTIKEAQPIRLELRKKLNTHPVAQLLHDASAVEQEYIDRVKAMWTNDRELYPTGLETWVSDRIRRTKGIYYLTDKYLSTFPESEKEKLRNHRGKNKGEWNERRYDLAQMIIREWNSCSRIEKYLRCGFWNFYQYNMDENEWGKTRKVDWVVALPPIN